MQVSSSIVEQADPKLLTNIVLHAHVLRCAHPKGKNVGDAGAKTFWYCMCRYVSWACSRKGPHGGVPQPGEKKVT